MEAFKRMLTAKAEYINSVDRKDEWLTLRDSINDQALIDAPADTYIIHMRMAYFQLLGGAMMQALGGPSALPGNITAILELKRLINVPVLGAEDPEWAEDTRCLYNKSYGSSSSNGIGAMAEEFSRLVAHNGMASRGKSALTEHFAAAWMAMIDELSQVKPDGFGRSSRSPSGGTGCLFVLIAVIGGFVVSHCLYSIL